MTFYHRRGNLRRTPLRVTHVTNTPLAFHSDYDADAAFLEEKARLMEAMTGHHPWAESFGAGSSDEYRSDDDESVCWDDEAGGE